MQLTYSENQHYRPYIINVIVISVSIAIGIATNLVQSKILFGIAILPILLFISIVHKSLFIYIIATIFGLNQTFYFVGNPILQWARWGILGLCVILIFPKIISKEKLRGFEKYDFIVIIFIFFTFISSL